MNEMLNNAKLRKVLECASPLALCAISKAAEGCRSPRRCRDKAYQITGSC
jgi:hypothetical protein